MNTSGNGSARVTEPTAEEPLDLAALDHILEEFKGRKGAVIPILQRAQDAYGYLPRQVLRAISQKTLIPLNQLYGVATFYAQFHLHRRGRHLIRVCDGTACHVRGSGKNIEVIERSLRVSPGETFGGLQVHAGDRVLPGLLRFVAHRRGGRQGLRAAGAGALVQRLESME